jgi:hypothetical protein
MTLVRPQSGNAMTCVIAKSTVLLATLAALAIGLAACAPEVGSPRWCEAMKEKPRGDWSANDALEYARSCVIQ